MSDAPTPSTPAKPKPTVGRKWGTSPSEEWVKPRDLCGANLGEFGTPFRLLKVARATSHGKAQIVLSIEGGRRFSVNTEGSTIGDQIAREGDPPVGAFYALKAEPSTGSPTGYSVVMEQVDAPAAPPA